MHQHLLQYSAHEKITKSDIKLNKIPLELTTEEIQKDFKKYTIQGIVEGEQNYHYKFSLIKNKPYLIYYKGNLDLLNQKILAIVGPRNITIHGKNILDKLFSIAKIHNLTTISWLAEGVDQYSHRKSIEFWIPTIAVLGWWLKRFLKNKSQRLLKEIIENKGLIISEYKINFTPTNRSFPQRNRIIAGLSDVIFIPEAWQKSGSLITADFGIQMNKPIYWSPNHILDQNSAWLRDYIEQWLIKPIKNLDKMLQKYFSQKQTSSKPTISHQKLSLEEKTIFQIIANQKDIDLQNIVFQSKFPIPKVFQILSKLEIARLIAQSSVNVFQKKQE